MEARMRGAADALSADTVKAEGGTVNRGMWSSLEVLRNLGGGATPPGRLRLKRGAMYFIGCNVSTDLPKYTKVVLVDWDLLGGSVTVLRTRDLGKADHRARIFALPRMQHWFTERGVELLRQQFPLLPAFAHTVHKAQGQTLRRVVVDIKHGPIFSHGMLYVAMSRVRRACDLRFMVDPMTLVRGRVTVMNHILREHIGAARIDPDMQGSAGRAARSSGGIPERTAVDVARAVWRVRRAAHRGRVP